MFQIRIFKKGTSFFFFVSAQLGCSDLIQPGLMGLQPNLDDLMDIDVVQGMCLVCFA